MKTLILLHRDISAIKRLSAQIVSNQVEVTKSEPKVIIGASARTVLYLDTRTRLVSSKGVGLLPQSSSRRFLRLQTADSDQSENIL